MDQSTAVDQSTGDLDQSTCLHQLTGSGPIYRCGPIYRVHGSIYRCALRCLRSRLIHHTSSSAHGSMQTRLHLCRAAECCARERQPTTPKKSRGRRGRQGVRYQVLPPPPPYTVDEVGGEPNGNPAFHGLSLWRSLGLYTTAWVRIGSRCGAILDSKCLMCAHRAHKETAHIRDFTLRTVCEVRSAMNARYYVEVWAWIA